MKFILGLALVAVASSAAAVTFWSDGVLYGTVCRSGAYYTAYPANMAQPVGSTCPVRDNDGKIVGFGTVTNE